MPIEMPGDPAPNPKHRWVVPVLIATIFAILAVPFAVVRYHNGIIQDNQNAVIDAMRSYARKQAAFFEKEKRYASSFEELGGEWALVRDATTLQSTIYHGYRFRAFTSRAAKDGAVETSFVNKSGQMTGGYAIMAVPANYGYSARLTFYISNPADKLWYTDLGVKTDTVSRAIEQYFIPENARSMNGL
ncbi:MAG: DUF2950 family protein [Planctomycetota bacterium]